MSAIDDLLSNNETYAKAFGGERPLPPALEVAVLACMDARMHISGMLGLDEGDAHIIRNAGGAVTDDALRSLAISQRLLGTREVMVIHHTDCGMLTFNDEEFRRGIEDETGIRPSWASETFSDLDQEVRQSLARIRANPFLPHTDRVRGFVFDVGTGRLREVEAG